MFICTELIEETGRPQELIFGMWGYFCLAGTSWSFGNFLTNLTKCNCHIFVSVKNHINAYNSQTIRDINMKT